MEGLNFRIEAVTKQLVDFFFLQAEDGIRGLTVTGVQTCALPISRDRLDDSWRPGTCASGGPELPRRARPTVGGLAGRARNGKGRADVVAPAARGLNLA